MAEQQGAEQPLLGEGDAPPPHLARKASESSRRFRRSRTAPASDAAEISASGGAAEKGPVLPAKRLFKNIRPSFKLVGFLLFVYLLVGCTVFYLVMAQISGQKTDRVLDALYFCIVTMTTVGYGDLVPKSDAAKLLSCAFVFSGMAIIALFVSKSADYLVEKQEVLFFKALHMHMKGGEAQMLRAIEANKIKYKFYTSAVLLLIVIVSGTLFLYKVEKLNLVDSFYCVCATITTLGYGDKSFSSKWGRVFAVFWIMASTVIVALFFLYLAELYTDRRQKKLAKWALTRRMTAMDLEAADIDGDRHVGPAEFVLYKLKEMRRISQEEISPFLEEFAKLDVDQSGTLSSYDLTLAQSTE